MSILKRLFRRSPRLTFLPLTETAQLPSYATKGAAGMDLYADEDIVIPFLQRELVKTNVAIDLPDGIEAQVRARSGLALKKGITVLNAPGTIDPDYTGGIGVILFNSGMEDFVVRRGDRIAQLVIASFVRVQPTWSGALLDESLVAGRQTARGASGFGSTGTGALAAGGFAVAALAPSVAVAGMFATGGVLPAPVAEQIARLPGEVIVPFTAPTVIEATKDRSTAETMVPAVAPQTQWVEGDPALMSDFSRAFVFRKDGSREFLDGKPSAAEAENARIASQVEASIRATMRDLHRPGGALHQA